MIKKSAIAYSIFFIATCYIITPWFFEKTLLFNELLAATGFVLLAYKRFRTGDDLINICLALLIAWCCVHLCFSLFLKDSLYYYFRNSVIVYSMFAFYIGFFCLKYLHGFFSRTMRFFKYYIVLFLFVPLPLTFYERYGVSTLFPHLFKNSGYRWLPILLIAMCIIYSLTYPSATALMIALFLLLLFISPGIKFFKQSLILIFIIVTLLFIYLQPDLDLIKNQFSVNDNNGIREVRNSNALLAIDANSTWRLVIWKQIVVDKFPANLVGIGFGTPMLQYYPVEDFKKVATLPYVMGGHNSFIYLFGRLGIVSLLLIIPMYVTVFREYFYHKQYYYSNQQILIFWSFFIITVMCLFNPILESPLFASGYWMWLGFTAKCIYNRQQTETKPALAS